MSERQKQTVFLKRLLQGASSEQRLQLQRQIAHAEEDERSVRLAMNLVGMLALLAAAGLCYSAVFVDDFFTNPTHLLTRLLGYLGLGSTLCWMMFLGYWLWHRALTNRLYEEGRRWLIATAEHSTTTFRLKDCLTRTESSVPKPDSHLTEHPLPLSKAA